MLPKVLVMTLALLLGYPPAAGSGVAAEIARKATLSNGLTLVVAERNQLPTIHLQVLIRAGSTRDPARYRGLANLTAETLLQGTKTREAQTISRQIESVGGSLSSGADLDFSTINLAVLKKDLGLGLDLLADVLLNPLFSETELSRKTAEIKARLKRMDEDPRQVVQLAFTRKLYGEHPYAYPVEGSADGLERLTRKEVEAFYRDYYRPNNAVLTLVGRVSLEEAREHLEKTLGGWQPAPISAPLLPDPLPLTGPAVVRIDRPISQANLVWGHLGVARDNPDYYALQVMNYVLGGGGFVSRLMDQLRDNLGLTYGVYSHFNARAWPGPFEIAVETQNPNANRTVSEILKELRRLLEKGVTETELKEAQSYLTGSFPLRMDTNSKTVRLLSAMEFYGLGLDYPEKFPEWINRVTGEDVLRAARKYIHPDQFLLVVVGDQREINLQESWENK